MTREDLEKLVRGSNNTTNVFYTHSGSKITLKEFKFINEFMKDGDLVAAVKVAGFEPAGGKEDEAHYRVVGKRLLSKQYIYDEMVYRIEEMEKTAIADANEIMSYFTAVMRGEVADQFGLDAPLSERTSAAKELAKRIIDVPAKATEEERAIKIVLDWKKPDGESTD